MSKNFKFYSKTANNLSGNFDLSDGSWSATQDVNEILNSVQLDKQEQEYAGKANTHYTKAFTLPDIIAIEILTKYGIDAHSDSFMHDRDAKRKVFKIIKEEYPHIIINKF